jgi:hypothetical protein
MIKILTSLLLATFCFNATAQDDPFDQSSVPLERDTTDTKLTKIVLLAGDPSSKSGAHEYFAGCALMMDLLKQTPGVHPVMARSGWPTNENIFKNAKAIVYFGDGGGKQPFLKPANWKTLEDALAHGAGLALFHQAVDVPPAQADTIKKYLGAVYTPDIGCRGHWDMAFNEIGSHPILRGVQPFTLPNDGWLYNVHFADAGVTRLLSGQVPDKSRTTKDAKEHVGRAETVAWAYDRPGGGRAFAFTGCDLHSAWGVESQRKLVINGILWSAGLEIPSPGAPVKFAPDQLKRNLDKKK